MKIIGTLDTKSDGDILKLVLDQAKPLFDAIYAYDDNSLDNTFEILKNHPAVSKVWTANEFDEEEKKRYLQHRRGWLLEQVKKDFPYDTEDIWVVRLEGDRFFMNQSPQEIVERAIKAKMDSRCGVMLDFRRHRLEGWENVDTFPNWHDDIRKIQRWFFIDDVHNVVAHRVADYIDYKFSNRPRPWPAGCKPNDCNRETISTDMCFFEHHGRRSPKYQYWSVKTGNRVLSSRAHKRDPLWDFSSPETVYHTMKGKFQPYRLFPYIDWNSVLPAIELYNNVNFRTSKDLQRYYFWGVELLYKEIKSLPKRGDI